MKANYYYLDGAEMSMRRVAYDHIKQSLQIKEDCGNNLDALNDYLSELKPNTTIYLRNSDIMLQNLDEYGKRMLEVFDEASEIYGFKFYAQ